MPLNHSVPSMDSMLEFQEVYTMAISLAWRDDNFRAHLIRDPMDALSRYFSYRCPWNVEIEINAVEANGREEFGWYPELGKWKLPRGKFSLCMPNRPADPKEITLALATYNDAGPTYLFTCC